MPTRSIVRPSGGSREATRAIKRGSVHPMSLPYAPVSSDDSHTSRTAGSAAAVATRSASASAGYDPRRPRACTVLQYVHLPRQPVDRGTISMCAFLRT